MKKAKWLSVVLALVLVFSLCTSAFAAEPAAKSTDGGKLLDSVPYARSEILQAQNSSQYKAGDQIHVILIMKSQPLADNKTLLERTFNTEGKLLREQANVRKLMDDQGLEYKLNYSYTSLLNGMSVTTDFANLEEIAAVSGVEDVVICKEYSLPDLIPNADAASEMINATGLDTYTGANGSGKVIAVLDTGITAGHEAFQEYPGMLQTPAFTEAQMRSKIVALGHGNYSNLKVPFQYDYADGDNDATDDGSSHGSHVAGIAAGYVATEEGEVTFHGSAPDAQILAMKIFGSSETTTSSDIYFAALEDAFKLEADVINMSIGAPNGFVEDSESVLNDRIYERLEDAGIICCISAGNESTMGEYSSNWANTYGGIHSVVPGYADYGVLGSPASYNSNVAVAAVENYQYPSYLIKVGEDGFPFRDCNGTDFLDAFSGQDLEYVMVPGLGEPGDFEGLDVKGKVAVITRGEINFADKVANAAAAGAKAAVVYDNREGALVTMAIDDHVIPAVFVSQEAGAALQAAETKVFHVDSEPTIEENPDAWSMASFSSWGPTNDLQIKPTITGVGGNVNSVLAGTTNGYEVQSGTSMSAPNVSGGYASLLEAISSENPDLSKAEIAEIARNRSLSTAYVLIADVLRDRDNNPIVDEDGNYTYIPYNPRQQGAGLLDVLSAFFTETTIDNPLVALGDDPDKSGEYIIKTDLKNNSDVAQTYLVSADVLTDSLAVFDFGEEEPDYHLYNLLSPTLLEEGTDYTMDAQKTVTLAPGEIQTVTVKITLSEEAMAYYLDYFENGIYIDGYVYFDSVDQESGELLESVHSTFLAFYGDWSAGPILETHDWRELMDVEIDPEYSENPLDYVDWEIDTTPSMAYLVDNENTPKLYAGDAPFGYPEDGLYSDKRIAVSNDPESAYFTNLLVVPTIIRNARHIIMIARDAGTNAIYAVDDTPYCTSTIYDTQDGWGTYAWFQFGGMDIYSGEEGTPLPDGTNVVLEFYANLPYGEDVLGSMTPEEILADGQQYLQYTVPVVVDRTAPEFDFDSFEYNPETGEVTVTVTDEQYLAAVYAVDLEGNIISNVVEPDAEAAEEPEAEEALEVFADDEPGVPHTVTLNVGDCCDFIIAAMDYATNEAYVEIPIEHDHVLTEVDKVEPTCEEAGTEAYWVCEKCKLKFADKDGTEPIDQPDTIEPLGHDLQKVDAVDATCTEDGSIEHWCCSRCGKLYVGNEMKEVSEKDLVVKATGHNLTAVAEVPATCEADGAAAHWKCETCGKLFSDAEGTNEIAAPEVIAKLGHAWDEGIVTKQPTLAEEGEKLFTCKNDPSHTKTEAVAKLGQCDGADNCPSKNYTDVDRSKDSWSHEPIDWAVLKDITNGTSKTTFSPNKACTRAEAVTFLWRAAGCPEPKSEDNPFKDVTLDSWYAKAVLWAVENGITDGTSDTTFSPDKTCTRGHIVTFLWRSQNKPEAKAASTFADVPANAYFAKAVDWAVEQGITNGTSAAKFSPNSNCTRAHIVTFLYRSFEQ